LPETKIEPYLGMNLENNIKYWQEKISHSIFLFLAVFGSLAYIPSVILSIKDNLASIAILDTLVYAVIIYLSVSRKISRKVQAIISTSMFNVLGITL